MRRWPATCWMSAVMVGCEETNSRSDSWSRLVGPPGPVELAFGDHERVQAVQQDGLPHRGADPGGMPGAIVVDDDDAGCGEHLPRGRDVLADVDVEVRGVHVDESEGGGLHRVADPGRSSLITTGGFAWNAP